MSASTWSWVASAVSVAGLWLSGYNPRIGWIYGIFSQIVWTSSRACDTQGRIGPSATGYPGYGYGMTVNRSGVIAGRVVYFSQGNHGSSAWTCVPVEIANEVDYVAVGIWESNGITPQQAMQLVAYAVPA